MRPLPVLFFALWQICLFSACRHQISREAQEEIYAYEIITQTIRELASPTIIPPPPPPPPDSSVEGSVEATNRILDSLKHAFHLYRDTATFLIAISQTFTEPDRFLLREFERNTYQGLASQLLSGKEKPRPLDKKRIGNISPWKVIEPRPRKGHQCGDREYLGLFTCSYMIFNDNLSTALLTYNLCGRFRGILMVKRQKGKWHIVRNDISVMH